MEASLKRTSGGVAAATGVLVVIAILVAGVAVGTTALDINHFGPTSSTSASSSSSNSSSSTDNTSSTKSRSISSSSITSSFSSLLNSSSSDSSTSTVTSETTTSTFSLSQDTTDSTSSTSSSSSAFTSSTTFTTVTDGRNYTISSTILYPSYAGYQAYPDQSGSSLLSVSASWKVPVANCNSVANGTTALSAAWVGIFDFRNIEQIGTESDCFGSSPSYIAWYEFWPAQQFVQTIDSNVVNPGDLMSAIVSYTPSSNYNYTLTITDQTQGWSKSVTGTGGGNIEPEWIVEAPVNAQGEPYPLANFGNVTFSSCSMTVLYNGVATTSPITNQDFVYPLEMFNGSTENALATTSDLSSAGTNFTIIWNNSQ